MTTWRNGNEPPEPNAGSVTNERQRLLGLAYRLLGSVTDAEDVVQVAYARWYAMSPAEQKKIQSPAAWLTTVASRICLDLLRSARVRRERYVGEWIPEPLPDGTAWSDGSQIDATADPADRVTLDESVNMAFLVVLESMTPAERVAFILHDVFGYSFPEIAEIVGRTPPACRQLATSARRRIEGALVTPVPTATQAGLVRAFKQAWEDRDIHALIRILDPDATVIADGGGLASAELRPIDGGTEVARACVEIAGRLPDMVLLERAVNGRPGLVALHDGRIVTVYSFLITGNRIKRIWAVRNPEKLRGWTTG